MLARPDDARLLSRSAGSALTAGSEGTTTACSVVSASETRSAPSSTSLRCSKDNKARSLEAASLADEEPCSGRAAALKKSIHVLRVSAGMDARWVATALDTASLLWAASFDLLAEAATVLSKPLVLPLVCEISLTAELAVASREGL